MPTSSTKSVSEIAQSKNWCLSLFFSVDLEGATHYKAIKQAQDRDNDWCTVFKTFYEKFPNNFIQSYSSPQSNNTLSPTVWKYIGDEILFYVLLPDSKHVLTHVSNFGQAIIDYNTLLRTSGLHCKGTMWLAGFPINNRIVTIPNTSDPNNNLIDFIGSSIDCGFRLSKFSTPRRLVLSLDLIWMVVETLQHSAHPKPLEWFVFRYHGEHELKGVFSGRKYPVFGLDLYANDTLGRISIFFYSILRV
jgi:hypothetical protein